MVKYILLLVACVFVFTVVFRLTSTHKNDDDNESWRLMKTPTVLNVEAGSVVVCDTITGVATCKRLPVPEACSDTLTVGYKINDFPAFVKKVEFQNNEEQAKSFSRLWRILAGIFVMLVVGHLMYLALTGRMKWNFSNRKKHKSKSKKIRQC